MNLNSEIPSKTNGSNSSTTFTPVEQLIAAKEKVGTPELPGNIEHHIIQADSIDEAHHQLGVINDLLPTAKRSGYLKQSELVFMN